MSHLNEILASKLRQSQNNGTLRTLKFRSESLEDFVSNDYLGLSRSKELFQRIAAKVEGLTRRTNGSTGSRLLAGNDPYVEQVEKKLANVFQAESSLIFNSGYSANLAVLSSVPQKTDTILYDERVHASIKDGIRLSLATRYPFRHNDLEDLAAKLSRIKTGKIFIVIESIYSMDGDESPLAKILDLSAPFNASIILDEAHSTGAYGKKGAGLAVDKELQNRIDIRIYTFGKAMGVHGACVAGSTQLRNYLINFARPFVYTTALPPHSIASIDCAFDFLENNLHLQTELKRKVDLFLSKLAIQSRTNSESAIQAAIFPGAIRAIAVGEALQRDGFDVRAIVSPTVPRDTERVRICLHTYNEDSTIEQLATALNRLEMQNDFGR